MRSTPEREPDNGLYYTLLSKIRCLDPIRHVADTTVTVPRLDTSEDEAALDLKVYHAANEHDATVEDGEQCAERYQYDIEQAEMLLHHGIDCIADLTGLSYDRLSQRAYDARLATYSPTLLDGSSYELLVVSWQQIFTSTHPASTMHLVRFRPSESDDSEPYRQLDLLFKGDELLDTFPDVIYPQQDAFWDLWTRQLDDAQLDHDAAGEVTEVVEELIGSVVTGMHFEADARIMFREIIGHEHFTWLSRDEKAELCMLFDDTVIVLADKQQPPESLTRAEVEQLIAATDAVPERWSATTEH